MYFSPPRPRAHPAPGEAGLAAGPRRGAATHLCCQKIRKHITIYTCVCKKKVYIYIYRERERDGER